MIAILPAAGLGTRMMPVTQGNAKEALPVGGRAILEIVIEEAREAGASHCVVVSSLRKPELNSLVEGWPNLSLVYQDEPLGLAHAICCPKVKDDVLVLLPDTIFAILPDAAAEFASVGDAASRLGVSTADGALLVEEVAPEAVSLYGIVETIDRTRIRRLVEKPRPGVTESRLAIAARYRFNARLLAFIQSKVAANEFELTSILQSAIAEGFEMDAVSSNGLERLDCGSPEGYREAQAWLGNVALRGKN